MQQKNAYAVKLVAAVVSLLGAVALLAFGTFAWFTTSTKGEVEGISVSFVSDGSEWPFEVSSDYMRPGAGGAMEINPNPNWEKELNITGLLAQGYLRPITTADLNTWYVATYSGNGDVNGFREVALEDVANIADINGADAQNHLLYCDLWVRTRDPEKTYALKLNNPDVNADGSLHLNEDETVYGTYVLWTPVWNTETNSYTASDDAMSSIRVGFQMFNQNGDGTVVNTVIYEPNADMHKGLGSYADAMKELIYVLESDEGAGIQVQTYTGAPTSALLRTLVPQKGADDSVSMVDQPINIRQKTSAWKDTSSLLQIAQWDSTQIQTIGEFVNVDGTEVAPGDLPALATIDKDHIQKIRVFFWLEGQDVDCWNQVAGGSIYANLEFRGDEVTS